MATAIVLPASPASAAVSLTVTADAFGATATPGQVTVITVTVMAGDTPSSGPVTITFTATRGAVVGVDNLGFPVTCSTRRGIGTCVTDNPIGAFQVVEMAASIKVRGGGRSGVMTLTAVAGSAPDGASGSDTESVPIT